MAEITANGYSIDTQNQWYDKERQRYLFIDPEWNLDPSTPDGLKLASDSEIWANLDELGLKAYNSKDPNAATGLQLNILYYLTTGKVRPSGTPSSVQLTLSGTDGTVIPSGSLAESAANGSRWATDSTVIISGGTALVSATCTVNGGTQASIGDITKIKSPTGGWQSVTNNSVATPGTNPPTDAELREIRNRSVALPGSNQVDNTVAAILTTDGVRRCQAYENDTSSAAVDPVDNPHGLPANSVSYVVDGGEDYDIALAIYNKKNPGCGLNAVNTPVEVEITSPATGNIKTIRFSRPDYINIVIVVDIENDGTLPPDAADLVTAAILDYVGGDLLSPSCGFNGSGFDIGEDVPISRMYTPINQVIGQYGNSYVNTLTLNGSPSNVTIAFNELSRFTEANITVTIS